MCRGTSANASEVVGVQQSGDQREGLKTSSGRSDVDRDVLQRDQHGDELRSSEVQKQWVEQEQRAAHKVVPGERWRSMPARALQSRLKSSSAAPTWAAWLPKGLQHAASNHLAEVAEADHRAFPSEEVPSMMQVEDAYAGECNVEGYQAYPSMVWVTMDGVTFEPYAMESWPDDGNACTYYDVSHFEQEYAQKDHAAYEDRHTVKSLIGKVWKLSRDAKGCHVVQQAFDQASGDEERMALASELVGHVWDAVRCAHANHVLQRCISTLRPQAAQFVIDELRQRGGGAAQAARHRFGCRVIERLLEHCSGEQVSPMVEDLLADAAELTSHAYGNYVMQHILEHCDADAVSRLTLSLQRHVATMDAAGQGGSVVGAALGNAANPGREALALALLREPQQMATMACSRWGHPAVKQALQLAPGPERRRACAELARRADRLRSSRYGRFVATCVATL